MTAAEKIRALQYVLDFVEEYDAAPTMYELRQRLEWELGVARVAARNAEQKAKNIERAENV